MGTFKQFVFYWALSFVLLAPLRETEANPFSNPLPNSLDTNDVSILYALPETEKEASTLLFTPLTQATHGALLPEFLILGFHKLVQNSPQTQSEQFSTLRVVSVRVDPCFKKEMNSSCQAQIRMVWQPLLARELDGHKQLVAEDAAVHSFYDLNLLEFKKLTAELRTLKSTFEAAPYRISTQKRALGVHPALLNLSTRKAFTTQLSRILLSHTGEKKISRVTVMRLTRREFSWHFEGIDRDQTQAGWHLFQIPRIGQSNQGFFQESTTLSGPNAMKAWAQGRPPLNATDNFFPFLDRYFEGPIAKNDREAQTALKAIARIENPKLHSAASIDCVSCHVAEPVRNWIEGTATHTKNFRAFGYYNRTPVVNRRTTLESDEVARKMSQP